MGINKEVYFGLAVDTKGMDIEILENSDQDLFYRPFCERSGKHSLYWIPQRGNNAIKPRECGMEVEVELPHQDLHPKCKEFLDRVCPDHRIFYVFFEHFG